MLAKASNPQLLGGHPKFSLLISFRDLSLMFLHMLQHETGSLLNSNLRALLMIFPPYALSFPIWTFLFFRVWPILPSPRSFLWSLDIIKLCVIWPKPPSDKRQIIFSFTTKMEKQLSIKLGCTAFWEFYFFQLKKTLSDLIRHRLKKRHVTLTHPYT